MIVQLASIGRAEPADVEAVLPALVEAAGYVDVDHSRLAARIDWVQYRRNFRAPVMVRPFGPPPYLEGGRDAPLAEIAIDVRRAKDLPYELLVREIVDRLSKALGLIPDVHECIHLEDWVRPSKSVIWAFNRGYWRHLGGWDETFDRDYASVLPGGVSDGTNPDFWRDQIQGFIGTLDRLAEWSELPDEIHVVELGVGGGKQTKLWLDTFAQVCLERGRDYLSQIRYLMADYSPHALARAREQITAYSHLVELLELDFSNPMYGLSHLRGRVLFAHTCNLYDNLPTDELMRVSDRAYEPLVRASITPGEIAELSGRHDVRPGELLATVQRVLRDGPESFRSLQAGVHFWSDVWDAVHLEEIYEQIPAPAAIRITPSTDMHLSELLADLPEWTRVQTSTVAVESFAQTLSLLHHQGVLVAQDIFAPDNSAYAAYRGPGKLEGSIVNWLNGPVFTQVAQRAGFQVQIEPFQYRQGSNTAVLTARPRDAYTRGTTRRL